MAEPQAVPYGSWKSPITADLIAAKTVSLGQIALDGDDVYWTETRPSEGGRTVVCRTAGGSVDDVTPDPFNARTRVHEYGGGAFAVDRGTVYFSNFADQRLYRQQRGAAPVALTPARDLRYADGVVDRRRTRLICVREDHTVSGGQAQNAVVAVALDGNDLERGGTVLQSGNDFYSSPRLDAAGARLAWLTWNHPNMPWDGTELWVAEVGADGSLSGQRRVAGGADESIFQPEWSPAGELVFISDRTGWWNLYRWHAGDGRLAALCAMDAEFGAAQWIFGLSTYALLEDGRIVCRYLRDGSSHLATLDPQSGRLEPVDTPFTEVGGIRAAGGRVVFIGGAPARSPCVVQLDLASGNHQVLRRASDLEIDAGYLSVPRAIEFPTERGLTSHAFFYPPANRDFRGPDGERPPLLVRSHGGPTSATTSGLSLSIQFWTSRGIAVLDVNYGGSTGYGRAYRQRLNGAWGIVDVDDCINGARYLAERGEVDAERLAIAGGSAGGYTTLAALTFHDTFRAGASYYGVSDLEALATETHKFESRYLDTIVGPYPERRDLYIARSPIRFVDRLSCPVIFFQGLEDKIVPPNQAELMVEALRRQGIPVAYLAFEGEQHGFRRGENVKRSLDAKLYFYSRIFGFPLADPVEPVAIDNL